MQKNNKLAPVATVEQLQVFFDAVKEIPYKNWGGCLFFCYVFFLWLKKNNYSTSSFAIIQYDCYDGDYIRHNEDFIKGETDFARSSAHFTWKYDGGEYDACGTPTYKTKEFAELKGLQTRYGSLVACFCENALINGSWNPDFNRNAAIDIVKKNLKLRIPKKIRR
jgi:hypothetical protein